MVFTANWINIDTHVWKQTTLMYSITLVTCDKYRWISFLFPFLMTVCYLIFLRCKYCTVVKNEMLFSIIIISFIIFHLLCHHIYLDNVSFAFFEAWLWLLTNRKFVCWVKSFGQILLHCKIPHILILLQLSHIHKISTV